MIVKLVVTLFLALILPAYLAYYEHQLKAENGRKDVPAPISVRVCRVSLWAFFAWYLREYIKYCYGYYLQYKILYSPLWSAKAEKMGFSVCLASELRDVGDRVTVKSTNNKHEICLRDLTVCCNQTASPYYGIINLAIRHRVRRDFIGPMSPLRPFFLKGSKMSDCEVT